MLSLRAPQRAVYYVVLWQKKSNTSVYVEVPDSPYQPAPSRFLFPSSNTPGDKRIRESTSSEEFSSPLKQAEKKVCDRETFAPSAPPLNFTTMTDFNTYSTEMSDRIEKGFQSLNRRFDTIDINLNTFHNNYITVRASIQAVIQERRSRNVIVSGIPETKTNAAEREDPDPDIHCLKIQMKIPYAIDYDDAYRLGKWAPGKTRSLLIKFVRMIDKRRFINHRINLIGENIYVNDDESKEQRITRSILMKQFKAEKSLDKDMRSYIEKDILFISKAGVLVRKYAVGKDGLPSLSA
jgi:hypothetical protein